MSAHQIVFMRDGREDATYAHVEHRHLDSIRDCDQKSRMPGVYEFMFWIQDDQQYCAEKR